MADPGGERRPAALNSWVEISQSAYARNLAFFRRRVGPEVELSAVVKSNAYGHGLEEIARLAIRHGADSFCVHALDEALALRRAGFDQDVLIMGHVPLARLGEVVIEDFRLVLYDSDTARRLAGEAKVSSRQARVHLKIETGTHRQGLDGVALEALLKEIRNNLSELEVEGVYTHFANIEDTTRHDVAQQQMARFDAALETLERHGIRPELRHAACSAAILLFDKTHFDMVRLGISQYGLWSSKETLLSWAVHAPESEGAPEEVLSPVLTWKARISQVKDVPAEAYVGYGCTYQTTRPSRLAVLPIGYADGYDRRLSNQAHVLIHGRRAPVRGRVCMNLVMVDVTDIPEAGLEDEAVLIGRQGEQEVTASDLAGWVGTIPYEIVARISPELPRLVVA